MQELDNYDAFVMGRVTYERFRDNWSSSSGNPYFDRIAAMPSMVGTVDRRTQLQVRRAGRASPVTRPTPASPARAACSLARGILDPRAWRPGARLASLPTDRIVLWEQPTGCSDLSGVPRQS